MKLKNENSVQKLRGAYYTPYDLATSMISKFITPLEKMSILEPSCGDGVFIESLLNSGFKKNNITAVEIEKEEIDKLKKKYSSNKKIKLINKDFFDFYLNNKKKFDLIIGNPPYIRYQYLDELQRAQMSKILKDSGMKPNKLINAWVGFVVACSNILSQNGTLAFVVPAELLQVVYAKELRKFLSNKFSEINIVTFKKLIFQDIEQEIVLLICKKSNINGIRIIQMNDIFDFKNCDVSEFEFQNIDNDTEKWTKYFINSEQTILIDSIKDNDNFQKLSNVAIINVGITTGNNNYFSIDKEINGTYNLQEYCIPLIGKSCQVHSVFFTIEDLIKNYNKNRKSYLLTIENKPKEELGKELKLYLDYGESVGVNKGYKCEIREYWYCVPSIWVPDAFFARRNNFYPKFIINNCNAVSTDTMHRLKFKNGYDPNEIVLSYYNSISFAFTEICGRSYGGGVLEILPSEVGNIYLPIISNMTALTKKELLYQIDLMVRNGEKIENILDYGDKKILIEYLGLSEEYCQKFRKIWKTLQCRRLERIKNK
ncbi:MAG: methyltransferase domain-containing protein [Erysipelotrichaceae bacterium]|nr:methyltransferase domain-containing protein [Erysipelotrichaceae bacterium]